MWLKQTQDVTVVRRRAEVDHTRAERLHVTGGAVETSTKGCVTRGLSSGVQPIATSCVRLEKRVLHAWQAMVGYNP